MLLVWRTEVGDRVMVMVPPGLKCSRCDEKVGRPLDPSRTGIVTKVGTRLVWVKMDGAGARRPLRKYRIHGWAGFAGHVPELRKI